MNILLLFHINILINNTKTQSYKKKKKKKKKKKLKKIKKRKNVTNY